MAKILTLLVLLMTAVTGAWAEDTYTVQFEANGNSITREVTLPHEFKTSYSNENGELDGIIKELYGLSLGYCSRVGTPTASGNSNVTASLEGNDQCIKIEAAFEGTAQVTGKYFSYEGAWENQQEINYTLTISVAATAPADPESIDLTTTDNLTWTLASMPGYDLELEVEYYPLATLATTPAAAEGLNDGTTADLLTPGTSNDGTLYYALGTSEAPTGQWSQTIPTTEGLEAGEYYVWYKVVGDAEHSDSQPQCIAVTVTEVPTQTITLAAGENWFSTNVEVTLEDLQSALVTATGGTASITINSQDSGFSTYVPGTSTWRGTLGSLDLSQMYMITVEADCEITLEGTPIDPASYPVTIKQGYTWIGMTMSDNISLTNAFAGFAVNGDQIFSSNVQATYNRGRWSGSLNTLEPGKGYIFKSASEDRTLVFPTE